MVTKFGENQICGDALHGNAGEVNIGGPNWPSADSSLAEVSSSCANECTSRGDCNYYIWFSDRGCRLQSDCTSTVNGYGHITSYICEKEQNGTK